MSTDKHKRELATIQLGMSLGAARNKLVNELLFSLACQAGSSVCYQCKGPILASNEMSIEHKEPWLHKPNAKDLYFELENISFSHLSCNISAARRMTSNRKRNAEGHLWCPECKSFSEHFWRNKHNSSGYNGTCNSCVNARKRKMRSNRKNVIAL